MKMYSRRTIFSYLVQFFIVAAVLMSASTRANDDQLQAASARPNLIPMDVALSTYSARSGDVIRVAWTTTNSGTAGTFASFTGIYLSTSTTRPPESATPLFQFTTPEIPAKSAVRQTNDITLPSPLPNGTFYIWINSDKDGFILQTSTTDDFASSSGLTISSTRIQPNLIPTNLVVSTTQARPGDQVTVTFSITNRSNIRCPASVTGLHLGTSTSNPDTGNVFVQLIDTPEIPANSVIHFTNNVVIPPGTALGNYYFWVVADDVDTSTLNQSSRTDDLARSSQLRVVSAITRPNLVPSDVTLSTYTLRPGDQVTVTWTMSNTGNANCPTNVTGLHLGPSSTNPPASDTLNLKIATPAINAGSEVEMSTTVSIPANFPVGTNYLWVVADDVPESVLDQSSKADDAARSAAVSIVTVIQRPNLVPLNVGLNAEFIRPGDELTVRWTMTNSGNGNCPASTTSIRLGTSSNTPPTTGFAVFVNTPVINTNSAAHQTNTITIPANTVLGTYYVWIVADDVENSTLGQSSKADDAARSGPLEVVGALPRPNLVPLNVTLSSYNLRPGDPVTVIWTTTNSGSGNCPASTTGLHLGTSGENPPATDPLNLKVSTPPISAGTAIKQTNVITIPANTPADTYRLWVVVDDVPNSTLNQTSKADDAARSAAFSVARATLTTPAANATVSAPPTFTWSAPGISTAIVYLAAKPEPVLGVDTVIYFDNPNGVNTFQPSLEAWSAAVDELGFAENYYWTVGSATATAREIYAEFRPFKTIPTIERAYLSNGQFRIDFIAPNLTQVILQTSENLTNWTDLTTLQMPASYTTAPTGTKRFYRAKP